MRGEVRGCGGAERCGRGAREASGARTSARTREAGRAGRRASAMPPHRARTAILCPDSGFPSNAAPLRYRTMGLVSKKPCARGKIEAVW